jgi:ribosomal protein L21E
MSDINDLSEEEKEQTQKWFDEAYIERDKYSELEAENARLKQMDDIKCLELKRENKPSVSVTVEDGDTVIIDIKGSASSIMSVDEFADYVEAHVIPSKDKYDVAMGLADNYEQDLIAANAKIKELQLSGNSGEFGWQSAEKLPEEEGIYAIMTNNGYEWEFRLTACSLQATLMNINVYHARGYEFYDIKYLKLPNVEGK